MTDLVEVRPDLDNSEIALTEACERFAAAVGIARELARNERLWLFFARLLASMEDNGDLLRLGYKSLSACVDAIKAQSNYSRSSMLEFVRVFRLCSQNAVDVPDMPQGSAYVFMQLPAPLQRDSDVVDSATTMRPKEFRRKIAADFPQAHIEEQEVIKKFGASQWEKINETLNTDR